jgi:hypothetical protein
MRRLCEGLGLLCGIVIVVAGCHSDAHLKPPKPPEAYNLPPEGDSRFKDPAAYPKDSLNRDILLQKAKEAKEGLGDGPSAGGRPRFGAGPGGQ